MFITTGYVVDAPALWAVCDKCSCGRDAIVTCCLFVCLFVFICICLWSYLCVLRLLTLVCDRSSDPEQARLVLTQFLTKFDVNATCHKVHFSPNCQKTSYQIFFPNLGFCFLICFFANQCQVVVSQWQKHKQI